MLVFYVGQPVVTRKLIVKGTILVLGCGIYAASVGYLSQTCRPKHTVCSTSDVDHSHINTKGGAKIHPVFTNVARKILEKSGNKQKEQKCHGLMVHSSQILVFCKLLFLGDLEGFASDAGI